MCKEFIKSMGGLVSKRILNEISEARYFSIIEASTPVVSNIDQLAFVLGFVSFSDARRAPYFIIACTIEQGWESEINCYGPFRVTDTKNWKLQRTNLLQCFRYVGEVYWPSNRVKGKTTLQTMCYVRPIHYAAENSCSKVTLFIFWRNVYIFGLASTYDGVF